MAFVKIDKSARTNTGAPIVTMATYLGDGKEFKIKSIAFRISMPLIQQLGWDNEETHKRFIVLEGTGDDRGFLQIIPDDKGYSGTRKKGEAGHGIAITVTAEKFRHYVLNECPVAAREVTHVVDNGVLLIECPDWLRFNPLSVPEEPKPEPKPVPKPVENVHHMRGRGRRG